MAGAGYKLFNTGDVLTAAQVNTYLMEQTVMRFATTTARDTALSGVLAEGMVCYIDADNNLYKYTGSAWVNIDSGSTSPLTTKGDLYTYSTSDARLAVGNNGETLVADSSTATGLKWAKDPVADLVTTAGDTLYATAADTLTRLGIGTAGQLLAVNSGATAPEWQTITTGGWTSLASGSLSGATLDLTSISNGYRTLVLILRDFYPNNDDYLRIRLNNTANVYGETGPGGADSSLTNAYITPFTTVNVDNVDSFNYLQFQIDDYANTTTGKSAYNRGAIRNTSGTTWRLQSLDSFANLTAAIDRITVSFNGGATFSGGTYQLYGVK